MRMEHNCQALNEAIISCRQCPRLVEWREFVALHKVRRFQHETYWGKPLTGFGDTKAELVIVGLAPAAHGGNRTGRMFTGDDSGNWLIDALYQTGFANQNRSERADDGLILTNAYVTAGVRCAPPQNKPTREEKVNCFHFLEDEINLIKPRVIVVLGRFAYDSFRQYLGTLDIKAPPASNFGHARRITWDTIQARQLTLLMSYHPSRQNTQTKKLTRPMFLDIFEMARTILKNREGLDKKSLYRQ